MEDSTSIAELEVAELRRKALAAAEEEARLWAEAQKVSIRQRKLDDAMEQVRAADIRMGSHVERSVAGEVVIQIVHRNHGGT